MVLKQRACTVRLRHCWVLDFTGFSPEEVITPDYRTKAFHSEDVARLEEERREALARGGQEDLYHLAEELLMEVDDLFPIVDEAVLLGFAKSTRRCAHYPFRKRI